MKRAILNAAKKGGVGKSHLTKAQVDLFRRAGRSVSAWDLDGQTGSLALYYGIGEPIEKVAVEDVRDPKAPGAWLEALHGEADDVVLDVPGGHLESLLRTFALPSAREQALALTSEVKAAGRELVIVSVLGTQRDATATAQEAFTLFGPSAHHVVVKNGRFAPEDGFLVFDGYTSPRDDSKKFGKSLVAANDIGAEIVYYPGLDPIANDLLDLEGVTFAQAAGDTGVGLLGRKHAGNVRFWLDAVAGRFAGTWLDAEGKVPGARRKAAAPSAPAAVAS